MRSPIKDLKEFYMDKYRTASDGFDYEALAMDVHFGKATPEAIRYFNEQQKQIEEYNHSLDGRKLSPDGWLL
jgi:hypothetical protein